MVEIKQSKTKKEQNKTTVNLMGYCRIYCPMFNYDVKSSWCNELDTCPLSKAFNNDYNMLSNITRDNLKTLSDKDKKLIEHVKNKHKVKDTKPITI